MICACRQGGGAPARRLSALSALSGAVLPYRAARPGQRARICGRELSESQGDRHLGQPAERSPRPRRADPSDGASLPRVAGAHYLSRGGEVGRGGISQAGPLIESGWGSSWHGSSWRCQPRSSDGCGSCAEPFAAIRTYARSRAARGTSWKMRRRLRLASRVPSAPSNGAGAVLSSSLSLYWRCFYLDRRLRWCMNYRHVPGSGR